MRDKLTTTRARSIYFVILLILLGCNYYTQTKEQVYNELVRQEIKHPDIVLAQLRLESANFSSNLYKANKNLAGMKLAKQRKTTAKGERYGFAYYSSWTKCIADLKLWQDKYYDGEKDYYKFLQDIGYCEGNDYISKLKEF